jgi:hypothetical protein
VGYRDCIRWQANVEIMCESFAEIDRVNKFGYRWDNRNILDFMNAIDKEKFMYVASQGKSKIIFMLKDNDPEIREIAQAFATFMTSKEE